MAAELRYPWRRMMKTDPRLSWWHRLADGRSPHAYALIFWLLSLVLFREPLISLARLSFHDELASHVLLIPLISAFLIYLERARIFRATRYCPSLGVPLLLAAAAVWSRLSSINQADRLSVAAALIVLAWIAGFVLFYGTAAAKAAAFPLLFLFLMSPLPGAVSDIRHLHSPEGIRCYLLRAIPGRGSTCRPARLPVFFARSRD